MLLVEYRNYEQKGISKTVEKRVYRSLTMKSNRSRQLQIMTNLKSFLLLYILLYVNCVPVKTTSYI